jgi:hypothetical protein
MSYEGSADDFFADSRSDGRHDRREAINFPPASIGAMPARTSLIRKVSVRTVISADREA